MSSELSEHKQRVAATNNLASAGYDKDAVRFFPLCANRLVELIDLQAGQRVLDVATGTGWAAIAASQRTGSKGYVVGVDIALDMLGQARRKVEARIRAYGVNFSVPKNPFSWQRLTSMEQCRSLLQDAGLEQIEGRSEQLGYYLRIPHEWWEIVWNSGFRGPVSQLSPEQLEQFKMEHLAEVEQLATEQGIWLDIAAFFVWGRKPPAGLSKGDSGRP